MCALRKNSKQSSIELLIRELGAVPIAVIIRGVTVWEKLPPTGCAPTADPVDSEHKDKGKSPGPAQKDQRS